MNEHGRRPCRQLRALWCALPMVIIYAAVAAPGNAKTPSFIEIYNSGVLTLASDEALQLTIANDNNVSDPALPTIPDSQTRSCTFLAQFLDASGNVLQKQQQTLEPGQNFSVSQSGQQTLQARVDLWAETSSGSSRAIADQCVVFNEIVKSSTLEPVLFPPMLRSCVAGSPIACQKGCAGNPTCLATCATTGPC